MWMPSYDSVEEIHYNLARIFESENDPISPVGIKSSELLSSACERPNTGIGDYEKYSTLERKLAALFHSLTKNHPFHNGNKRTAIVTVLTALYRNNKRLDTNITDDDIYDFVLAVTADEFPNVSHGLDTDEIVLKIAEWIKQNTVAISVRPSGMKLIDFKKKCEEVGCSVKSTKGGSYLISYKGRSIRVSKSSKQFDAPVIRNYLNKLGLNEVFSGLSIEEFQEGITGEREQIYRYMVALKRLAKT